MSTIISQTRRTSTGDAFFGQPQETGEFELRRGHTVEPRDRCAEPPAAANKDAGNLLSLICAHVGLDEKSLTGMDLRDLTLQGLERMACNQPEAAFSASPRDDCPKPPDEAFVD
jgi:hypothetical protein